MSDYQKLNTAFARAKFQPVHAQAEAFVQECLDEGVSLEKLGNWAYGELVQHNALIHQRKDFKVVAVERVGINRFRAHHGNQVWELAAGDYLEMTFDTSATIGEETLKWPIQHLQLLLAPPKSNFISRFLYRWRMKHQRPEHYR